MPARIQEVQIGIGFKKQSALQTALVAGDLWSLRLNAFNAPIPAFNNEDDSEDFGKADDWVTTLFPSSIDQNWTWPYYLTSQNFAQVAAFGCGKAVKTTPAAGAYQYVCTPLDGATDGIDLPATTVVSGIRQNTAGELIDIAAIGMACAGFSVKLLRGPGRQNSQIESRWVGSGKHVNNSGIAIPAATTETRLGAGSTATLSINGVDYIANKRFVDCEFTLDNGINSNAGYFVGSGQQNGYDLRGRIRVGKRTVTLVSTVELEAGSQELTDLLAGTEGAIDIKLEGPVITGAIKHTARIEAPRCRHKGYALSEAEGYVAARVETSFLKPVSGAVFTLTAITTQDNILTAAS